MGSFILVRRALPFLILLAAAGCGASSENNSPTAPSAAGGSGATIAGTVSGVGTSGLTVAVAGTNLSTGVENTGNFRLGGVPAGLVRLQFRTAAATATALLPNVTNDDVIQIQVQVSGASATIVSETRSTAKVVLCHRTGNGTYHSIEISVRRRVSTSGARRRQDRRSRAGRARRGSSAPTASRAGPLTSASVRIKKATNGQDADNAPGPTVPVNSTVTWTYVVTNTGNAPLTAVVVRDDPNGPVPCPRATLAAGESMTCMTTGVAIAGQYRNVGTVTATWSAGSVSDSDASHYFGQVATAGRGTESPTLPSYRQWLVPSDRSERQRRARAPRARRRQDRRGGARHSRADVRRQLLRAVDVGAAGRLAAAFESIQVDLSN